MILFIEKANRMHAYAFAHQLGFQKRTPTLTIISSKGKKMHYLLLTAAIKHFKIKMQNCCLVYDLRSLTMAK